MAKISKYSIFNEILDECYLSLFYTSCGLNLLINHAQIELFNALGGFQALPRSQARLDQFSQILPDHPKFYKFCPYCLLILMVYQVI